MEIQNILGYLLNISAKLIKRKMDTKLVKYGLTTAQWAVLKALDENEAMSQVHLAMKLNADKATIGTILFKLIDKGYVYKQIDSEDRRSYKVSLTSISQNIVHEIEATASSLSESALSGFSDREKDNLYASLKRIIHNLSEENEDELEV